MRVTRAVLAAGVVSVRGWRTARTSGLCGLGHSIPHMASTQETKSSQDQESTLPGNLHLKFLKTFTNFSFLSKFAFLPSRHLTNFYLFMFMFIPSSNFVSFLFFPFQLLLSMFQFIHSNIYMLKFLWKWVYVKLWPEEGQNKSETLSIKVCLKTGGEKFFCHFPQRQK